jgi:uncharacterized protein YdeI (YjbR/CyaY-like superfamily)
VLLIRFKQASGEPHVPYADVVEEALCFGWVDSTPRKVDGLRSALTVTPRKPGSAWSAANRERVERLTAAGLMAPAGLAAVEVGQANGGWEALRDVEALAEPGDLRAALDAMPAARDHWDAFPPSTKRAILDWIRQAKQPATRERRVRQTVDEAAVGRRANQWRQPGEPGR